ncbi:MAG: hypothetical protein ACYS99_04670, partial [Planctomycetota bacterium]
MTLEEDGRHPLTFRATTAGGNEAKFTVDVVYDHVPPRVEPLAKQIPTNSPKKDVLVTVTDDSGLWGFEVAEVWADCPTTARKFPGELSEGRWRIAVEMPADTARATFDVRSRDEAGNVGEAQVVLILDSSIAPVALSLKAPLPESKDVFHTKEEQVSIVATTDEKDLDAAKCRITASSADESDRPIAIDPAADIKEEGGRTVIRKTI